MRRAVSATCLLTAVLVVSVLRAEEPPGALPPPRPADERVVRIKALVGGRSDLMLWERAAAWVHIDGSLPGASDASHPDGPYSTTIDGREWLPRWQGINSDHLALAAPLPSGPALADVELELESGRGTVTVRKVGQAVAVSFDDSGHPGSEWYEVTVRIALVGPPPSTSSSFVDMQADYQARQAARARLAEEEAALQKAWQQGVVAEQEVMVARQVLAAAHAEALQRQEEVEEAEYNVDLWLRRQRNPGRVYLGDGVHVVTVPAEIHWLDVWRERLARRVVARDDAVVRLGLSEQEVINSQENLVHKGRIYRALLRTYQTKLRRLYLEEFTERRKLLTEAGVQTRAANRARRIAVLDEGAVAGLYVWVERGREGGRFRFEPGQLIRSAVGDQPEAGKWEVGPDGLRVMRDGQTWLFLPGPSDTYLGTCQGPAEATGRKALLQPVQEGEAGGDPAAPAQDDAAAAAAAQPAGAGPDPPSAD